VIGLEQHVRPYVEHLERLPFVREVELLDGERRQGREVDGYVRLTTPTRKFTLPFELKRTHLTRELAARMVQLAKERRGLLVMAPAIGRDLADLFARDQINFVDLAGNCFVQLDDRYVAQIQGQRAAVRPPAEKVLRAPAYRVLFALVADPELVRATARALAEAAGGVSPQTANDVRAKLIGGGVLLKTRAGVQWAPGRRKEALDIFLVGFPALMPNFVIGRYRAKQRTPEALEADLGPRLAALGEWRWGGGAAAQRLTGLYRGDRTIVYLREPDAAAVRALPLIADPAGEVTLTRAPGPLAFEGPRPDTVHPLLVYADLMTEGHDRAREAAAEIYHRYLEEKRS
jgi:hypothetical protein